MAKKFIDEDKCRNDFYNMILDILSEDSTNDRANEIIDAFDSLPAADVQEVVRCKDCKYRNSSEFCECREPNAYYSDGAKMDGGEKRCHEKN